MKKVLSLLLAVVLVCSMATMASAISNTYTCERCNGVITDSSEFTAHIAADNCAACPYCNAGFLSQADVDKHSPDCRFFTGTCDYCGASVTKKGAFDAHVEACKADYFNIPLYKICTTIENFVRTTDWNNIANKAVDVVNTIKGVVAKIVPTIEGLLAKIPVAA